jgi:hypothetical protein
VEKKTYALPTLALTIWQPYASLVMLVDPKIRKDVENRNWSPGPNQLQVGDRVWIHAGRKLDIEANRDYEHLVGPHLPRGMMLGHCRYDGFVRDSDSPWYTGDVGWLFSDPVPLRAPVECFGAQRLWRVNENMMSKLQAAA